jgi:hypothetical protein
MPKSIGGKAEDNDELVQAVRAVFEKKKNCVIVRKNSQTSRARRIELETENDILLTHGAIHDNRLQNRPSRTQLRALPSHQTIHSDLAAPSA